MHRLLDHALGLALGAALGAILCPAVPAQDTEDPEAAPWLRVLTRDADLARRLAAKLGAEPAAFELQGDERAQLEVLPDGSASLRELPAGGHPKAWAEVFARTAEVLPKLLEEHEAEVARAALQLDVVLQAAGLPPGYGKELSGQALSVLRSLSGAYVRIEGDPREPAEGMTAFLDLVPQPGTGLHDWVRALSPSFRGAPAPPSAGAPVTFQVSLNQDSLRVLLSPFTDLVAGAGARTAAERERYRELFETSLESFDGTGSCSLDGEHLVTYTGLRDPEAWAKTLGDERYHAWLRAVLGSGRGVEAEVQPAALEHRGVVLLKTAVHSENPLIPETVGYEGVAGSYEVYIAGASVDEAAVQAAVDAVVDAEPARSDLPDSGIFVLDLDVARILDMLPPELAELLAPRDSMPDHARILLHKIGITVKLRVELRKREPR